MLILINDFPLFRQGHWLGLFHTVRLISDNFHSNIFVSLIAPSSSFKFSGCSEPGDGVSDTPLQDLPTSGCPSVPKNSCGKGSDPIDNFMDYSSDACKTRFTAGQAKRMEDEWIKYRS